MIRFENVSKSYADGFLAVKSLDFQIKRGEILVLIGPSGCGKTTTLKMINRLIPHTGGVITLDDQDITKQNVVHLRRNIGYVIQQIGLFPHYTIEDNIALVPKLNGWSKAEIKDRVQELLHMVGLEPNQYAKRYPSELSGGQQQRVGVARALACNPDVILMDEPFGALDPITREQLQDELLNLQQNVQKTIVFVTHDIDEALKLGDRIAIMKDGELLQLDTPDMILREPASGFVEQFIGKHRIHQDSEKMPVTDVMRQDPVTTRPDRSPAKALNLMRRHRTNTLLVRDEDNLLLGIVSAYELLAKMNEIQSISEIMVPADPYLNVSATAKDALHIMNGSPHGIIPVVGDSRRLIGVVTRGSLLTALSTQWIERGTQDE